MILLHHGKDCWPTLAHPPAVPFHDIQIGTDCFRKVDLVYDQQIRLCDPWSSLARNLVTSRHVNDVDDEVGEFAGVVGCKVVATRFDEEEVGVKLVVEVRKGQQIDGDILTNGRVRAATCLDGNDALTDGVSRYTSTAFSRVTLTLEELYA